MNLAELARAIDAELHGDPGRSITGVAGIEEAGPEHISFIANPRYSALARTTHAGAVIVAPDFPEIATATLRTPNPYLTFAKAVRLFYQEPDYPPGIHPTAVIDPTVKIGKNAHVGPYVVVSEGAIIGDNATLLPH
ncbi:MAG: LpxD N-terminal domain-containing protein, partial [Acidobacteriaceae bacterium]